MPSSAVSSATDLGQADDAVLGRDVGGLERRGDEAVRRGDVDDAAAACRAHRRQARGAMVWKADERLMARIASHFAAGKSSIGATCWMPALLTRMSSRPKRLGVGDHRLDRVRGFDMSAAEWTARDAERPAPGRCAVAAISSGVPKPLSTIAGAGAGERARDAEADAAGRAGDDGDLALERAGRLDRARRCRNVHGVLPRPSSSACKLPITAARRKCRVASVSIRGGYRKGFMLRRARRLVFRPARAVVHAGARQPVISRVPRWKVR